MKSFSLKPKSIIFPEESLENSVCFRNLDQFSLEGTMEKRYSRIDYNSITKKNLWKKSLNPICLAGIDTFCLVVRLWSFTFFGEKFVNLQFLFINQNHIFVSYFCKGNFTEFCRLKTDKTDEIRRNMKYAKGNRWSKLIKLNRVEWKKFE